MSKVFKVYGPSMAYFSPQRNILLLGDFHDTMDSQNEKQSIYSLISNIKSVMKLFIEDHLYIGATSHLRKIYGEQKRRTCTKKECRPLTSADFKCEDEPTLRCVNDFVSTCGRDDSICPIKNRKSKILRMDIRAQTLARVNNEVVQVVDDRNMKFSQKNFQVLLRMFINPYSCQAIALGTGIELKVIKSIAQAFNKMTEEDLLSVTAFWNQMIENKYPPWIKPTEGGAIFCEVYNESWEKNEEGRLNLLNLIAGNALLDLYVLCQTHIEQVFDDDNTKKIFYMGCAHVEVLYMYMSTQGLEFKQSMQNQFRLNPVSKYICFEDVETQGEIETFFES